MNKTLVIVRHGQSTYNAEGLFTGWRDVPLTERGEAEARRGGQVLAKSGLRFDLAYTSVLKRAIKTLWLVLEELDQMWIPVHRTWRLNERHYGSLQGLDKRAMTEKHGAEQVHQWRRGFAVRPPEVEPGNEDDPARDPRYRDLAPDELPRTESLKDTIDRFMPWWQDDIAPKLRAGQCVLVAAHGNSLRALVKHLEGISDEDIAGWNIPTGVPYVLELDEALKPTSTRYLGDPADIERRIAEVAGQAEKKTT